MITVILPAAGKGTRLGLPYSKELYKITEDRCLIDYTFDLFKNVTIDVQFVVVINENKTDIVKYLGKYNDYFPISFIYQDSNQPEYTGAIMSARNHFTNYNVVLLPDSILKFKNTFHWKDLSFYLKENQMAFFYVPETRQDMLRTKGALYVIDDIVTKYCDKPIHQDLAHFNAYWGGFAFTESASVMGLCWMKHSTMKHEIIELEPVKGAAAIEIESYRDLGTWDEIKRFQSNV